MHQSSIQQIANSVKTNRKRKNYTQNRLATLCGISLRSIQRIERGEVLPRDYTLKVLSEQLEIPLHPDPVHEQKKSVTINRQQRIILSAGLAVAISLLGSAFVFQSLTFPETAFETSLYIAALATLYMMLLLVIWHR